MKRSLAVLAVAALATSLQTPQAHAAPQAQISNVQVFWATDQGPGKVRVTWTESTPVANTVSLRIPGGHDRQLGTAPVPGQTELVLDADLFNISNDPNDSVTAVVTDPDGGSAASPAFDRYLPYKQASLNFAAGGQIRWTTHDLPADPSPGDPLDVDQPMRYEINLYEAAPDDTCIITKHADTADLTGLIPRRTKPYNVHVNAHNEWGKNYNLHAPQARVGRYTLTIEVVPATQYGAPVTFRGTFIQKTVLQGLNPPPCFEYDNYVRGDRVTLEARNTPTSPWYVVGLATTSAGRFALPVANPGGREYRIVRAPAGDGGLVVVYGTSTAATLVRATTKLNSAKFINPVINYGAPAQAYLWVDPAGSQRAALQFKNTSGAWQGLHYKTLSSGRGLLTFPWNRRGVTQFRWWVPGTTTATGLKVEPIFTKPFTLTVR